MNDTDAVKTFKIWIKMDRNGRETELKDSKEI